MMYEEYGNDMKSPLLCEGFEENIDIEYDDMEFDPEELEKQLEEEAHDMALSQAQGAWLDGYLDAMDELEDEEDV